LALQRAAISNDRFGDFFLSYMQKYALQKPEALAGPEGEAWKKLLTREDGRLTLARTLKAYRSVVPYLWRIQRELPRFKRPALILWGKHDPFCTLPTACRFMRLIPDSEVRVINNASHFLQEDNPEETAKIILEFIQRAQ